MLPATSKYCSGQEKTEVLVITRCDYEMYAGKLHKLFIEQRVKFLRQCPLIEQALQQGLVSTADIASMANCLNERSLNGNQIVVRQGEPVECMIFVRSGSLAMLRLVEVDSREPRRGADAFDQGKDGKRQPVKEGSGAAGQKAVGKTASGNPINLAKAMIEMKRKERDLQLAAVYMKNPRSGTRRESLAEATAYTERFFGRRASFEGAKLPVSEEELARAEAEDAMTATASLVTSATANAGKGLWGKLRKATRQAATISAVAEALDQVQAEAEDKTLPGKARHRKAAPVQKLLRVGSVGAFQYFGDKEVCNSEVFPCSLMSDPIADIYIMSKHDISRRLPKNLFSALFSQDIQKEPTDAHLLGMLRQNERWFTFRRSMHAEVLIGREQDRGAVFRATAAEKRIDAAANFEFL
ncbi:unnamed protein product, partial [Symbiodinium pilosum]